MFARITFDPSIMGGRACIRGMRLTVSLVVNLGPNGVSPDDIVREYPDLEPEDVREALSYERRFLVTNVPLCIGLMWGGQSWPQPPF